MSGRPAYAWEPDKGAYVGVMKRGGSAKDIRWFRGEACYVFHAMNAWEEGDTHRRRRHAARSAGAVPLRRRQADPAEKQIARLARWTFNMADGSDTFTRVYLDDLQAEFPRIDDRRAGLANRHGWFAAATARGLGGAFNSIAHVDNTTGRRKLYELPQRRRHVRARVRAARGRCAGGRRLAAGHGVARRGEPQRSCRVQTPPRSTADPLRRWSWRAACRSACTATGCRRRPERGVGGTDETDPAGPRLCHLRQHRADAAAGAARSRPGAADHGAGLARDCDAGAIAPGGATGERTLRGGAANA